MKKPLAFLLFAFCFVAAVAQDSLKYKLADYYHDSASSAFNLEEYDTACKYTKLHLDLELSFDAPRQVQMIESYIINAFCEFKAGRYKQSIEVYNEGLKWVDNAGSAAFAKSFFQFIDLCYTMLESTDSVYYQYSDKDYRKSFTFRIEDVLSRNGTKFRVQINAGLNDGLVKGAVAFPVSAPLPDSVPSRLFQLGRGEIVEVYPWYAIAEVEIYDSTDVYNWIQAGDVIETRILSKFKEETTLYKLLGNDVYFKNNDREQFLNPRYILHYDSRRFQSLMLQLMAQQIAETEELTREADIFLTPANKGQNTGKSIHDLFLEPDTADIHDFLGFVHSFPRKYMSKDYKVNETYATWLLNNSPSTPGVILDSLLATNSTIRQLEILEFNESDLTGGFYETWGERATEYAAKQQYRTANKCINAILLAANYLANTKIRAYGYFEGGKLYKTQNLYSQAIAYYDSAAIAYLHLGDSLEYARSIYKKGDVLGDWSKYKESIANFELAEKVLRKARLKSDSYAVNELLAYILWDKGYTVSEKGDQDAAIKAYDEAEKILNRIDGSKSDRATLYRNIAYVSKKKGEYQEALERYKTSGRLFYEAGYGAKYATAFDDIGDTYFKMGQYRDAISYYQDAYEIKISLDDKSGAGFSTSNIGQAYWNLGNYDSAILFHRQAIALNKEVNDVVDMAYSYEKIAALWKESGSVDSAVNYYSIAQDLYISNNDTTDKLAKIKESIGTVYYNVKNYDKAISYYETSKKMYENIGNEIGIANGLYNLALCYYEIKSYEQARDYLLQAKAKYQYMEDKEQTMYVAIYLSLIQWNVNNDYKAAEKLMAEALLLAKESNSLTNQGYTWRQLGWLKKAQGKFENAKNYFDSAYNAYQQSGDYAGLGYTNIDIGLYYIDRGEFAKSRQLFGQVANEATEKKNGLLASSAFISLADYYNLVGEYDSAKNVAVQSLALNNDLKNEYVESGAYISLGNTYNYLAENKTAVQYYFKADSVYQVVNDPFSRAVPVNNIGTIFFHQGDFKNALLQFNEVYKQLEKVNYKGELLITATLNIGEVYYEDGVLPEAEKWLKQGLQLSQNTGNNRGVASANLLLGKLCLKQKKYTSANTFLQAAYKNFNQIGEKERIIETGTFLGKLYSQTNKNDSAKIYLSKAISIAQQTGNTRYQWEPLYLSSTISLKQKDTAKAIIQLKEAVDILENIKGNIAGSKKYLVSFTKAQDKFKLYQDLVELLVGQNDVKTAFYYQEKSNITGLSEQTRGGDNGPTRSNELLAGVEEQSVAKELELKIDGYYGELIKERSKPAEQQSADKINKLLDLINVSETNFQGFVDSAIIASGGDQNSFSSTIDPKKLDNARFSLGDEDIVIEYLATENQLLIFAASNNSLNARKVNIKKAELISLINEFQQQVSTSKSDKNIVLKNSEKLYQLFIAPIEDLLTEKKRIALVPTGILYKLPFQALGKLEGEKINFLISRFEIAYINDLRFVYQAQAGASKKINILAFGNADKTLDNAENEVNDISSVFPNTVMYLRDSASEDKAKEMLMKFTIVHFATHGRLDPINFDNSYLVLAPNTASNDDGRFTMSEIREFKNLRSIQLLVLSACNMAVSDEKADGWVNTPANEFIIKGVGTVIATQWQVHDEATSMLMGYFYRNLKEGMPYSQALSQSQMQLADSEAFAHPYYWSAFEAVGKW